jgi:hypothetical protein
MFRVAERTGNRRGVRLVKTAGDVTFFARLINRYASYTSGGYQTRLKKIFGRTLGKYLAGLLR